MPHIAFHFYPGRTEEKKQEICQKLKECVVNKLGFPEDSVSISIVEIEPENFKKKIRETYDAAEIYVETKYIK